MKWLQKNPKVRPFIPFHLEQMERSQFFSLPDGGSLVTEAAVQLLDDVSLIRLPFENVILEYNAKGLNNPGDGYEGYDWEHSDRRIIFVKDRDDHVAIAASWDYRDRPEWWQTPWFSVRKTEFLDFSFGRQYQIGLFEDPLSRLLHEEARAAALRDIAGEVSILARFIAALSCRNVGIERIGGGRDRFSRKKSALPYNTYHQLVIKRKEAAGSSSGECGERRVPREHLRMGHIRRLHTGGHIWVNAALVNAGVGGKVSKDYKVAM